MSEWISVNDRLPDEGEILPSILCGRRIYSVYTKETFLYLSEARAHLVAFYHSRHEVGEKIEVSHWMSLPPAPEE